ncbi:hypothetical protein [Paeniglutamicibacter antarcticus]|uniref:Uncharacterized protein n=1 Tax=Paeniglutamicibacter antarcticus TaxID=494023 RepID=A0ABP9TQ81_9MICC
MGVGPPVHDAPASLEPRSRSLLDAEHGRESDARMLPGEVFVGGAPKLFGPRVLLRVPA